MREQSKDGDRRKAEGKTRRTGKGKGKKQEIWEVGEVNEER